MAYEESIRSITLEADSSIGIYTGVPGQPGSPSPHGGKQYYFLKVTGDHTAGLADNTDTAVVGVLQNKPQTTGSAATVAIRGVSLVSAGEAIAAGDVVYVGAGGQGAATGTTVVGVAIKAATAADQLIPVLLTL
jgi:hypothetical protein